MKALIGAGLTAALLTISVGTLADNENWDAEKARQIAINRCADAGKGNGAERLRRGECVNVEARGEDWRRDIDPGNSGDHNANNE